MKPQKNNSIFYGIIGLIFIGFILFLLAKGLWIVVNNIDKLNANIIVAILAGSFTITGFFVTRYLEKKKIIEQQIREQKIPIYQDFLDFVFSVFKNKKSDSSEKGINKEMEDFFWTLNQKSILWLSDTTLKSYANWKSEMQIITSSDMEEQIKTKKLLLSFEKLLLDFRKDIGHQNKNIIEGDILKLFVNDWKDIAD